MNQVTTMTMMRLTVVDFMTILVIIMRHPVAAVPDQPRYDPPVTNQKVAIPEYLTQQIPLGQSKNN